jgi:hypothetical protein
MRCEQSDRDAFLKSCRSDTIKTKRLGVSGSTISSAIRESDILNSFRRAGVKIKSEHLIER